MRSILVATDFSERSDRALRRATLLARTFGASVLLVHVVDDDQPRRIVNAEQQAAGDILEEQAQSLREIDGLNCQSRVVLGEAFEGITRTAREADVDLVIVGPHRRQALRDVFIGTTAERTIRESERPVLMANAAPSGAYRQLLIATDLSACSGHAVQAVTTLGLERDISIAVVHVFDAPASALMTRSSMSKDQIEHYLADERDRATGELTAFLARFKLGAVSTILQPATAPVAQIIWAAAREVSAQLIVVGTHGRSGLAKALLGSVTEEVLRVASRDVLAVPPRGAATGAS